MKALIAFISLMFLLPTANAVSIDVTNDPNASFYEGYERLYRPLAGNDYECSAFFAEMRGGYKHIATNSDCAEEIGLSEETVKKDLKDAMAYVKNHSGVDSFARFFELTGYRYFTRDPQQFCIKTPNNIMLFVDVPALDAPGWKNIYWGIDPSTNAIGQWKVDNGTVIARIGHTGAFKKAPYEVAMSKAEQCGNTPYAPNMILPAGRRR